MFESEYILTSSMRTSSCVSIFNALAKQAVSADTLASQISLISSVLEDMTQVNPVDM